LEERRDREHRVAQSEEESVGWQEVGGRRVRIGGGRVMGESVRGVARWYGNERFRGPVGGQAAGRREGGEGGGSSNGSGSSNAAAAGGVGSAARDRVGLVRRTPQRVT